MSEQRADEQRAGGADGREQLVDELRMLLEAAASRAEEGLRGCAGTGGTDGTDGTDADSRASSSRWCPLCAATSVIRGERPELARLLVERFAEVVALLRQFVAEGGPEPPGDVEQEPAAPKAQRIDVRRVDGRLREEREC